MKLPILLLEVIILAVVVLTLVRFARARVERARPGARDPREVTRELRDRLLRGAPSDFGIAPDGAVWGVLMETGYPQAVATLAALADGSASIYFSTGGGVIGGGPHARVNAAARNLVGLARGSVSRMTQAAEFPLPSEGNVRFYVLSTDGVVSAEGAEEDLGAGNHAHSALFLAGHAVITALREIEEAGTTH